MEARGRVASLAVVVRTGGNTSSLKRQRGRLVRVWLTCDQAFFFSGERESMAARPPSQCDRRLKKKKRTPDRRLAYGWWCAHPRMHEVIVQLKLKLMLRTASGWKMIFISRCLLHSMFVSLHKCIPRTWISEILRPGDRVEMLGHRTPRSVDAYTS